VSRSLTLLLTLLLCLALAPAARADEPARAVKGFFQAVVNGDYARSWNLLSSHSQARIVAAVARDEGLDPQQVRRLFESNAPAVQNGFWANFRSSSRSEVLAFKTFTTLNQEGNRAAVGLAGQDGSFVAVRETGVWRFGLFETFPPGR